MENPNCMGNYKWITAQTGVPRTYVYVTSHLRRCRLGFTGDDAVSAEPLGVEWFVVNVASH